MQNAIFFNITCYDAISNVVLKCNTISNYYIRQVNICMSTVMTLIHFNRNGVFFCCQWLKINTVCLSFSSMQLATTEHRKSITQREIINGVISFGTMNLMTPVGDLMRVAAVRWMVAHIHPIHLKYHTAVSQRKVR